MRDENSYRHAVLAHDEMKSEYRSQVDLSLNDERRRLFGEDECSVLSREALDNHRKSRPRHVWIVVGKLSCRLEQGILGTQGRNYGRIATRPEDPPVASETD